MGLLTKSFDKNASAEDNARQKSETLQSSIDNQRKKVDLLREMVAKATEKYGDNATQTLKLKEALYKAEGQEKDLEKQQEDLNTAVKDGSEVVEDSTGKWDKFKEVAGGIAKGLGAAAAAVGALAYALGKKVVSEYAELEQNLGGSQAVFGDYFDGIVKESQDAYKTMGVSQSNYLASANKTAALFQGSGLTQQRSLEVTTAAMQRAADMASVMGIDTEDALNAITGAAKGNYTMMDNLGVAMNATTLSAYAISKGMDTAWSSMSNAEKAELAMQYFFENTEQYAGNFERESVGTISGSIGSLMASIDTFVAGLGDSNADIEGMTNNIIQCFANVVTNIQPILQNLVKAAPDAIQVLIDAVGAMLPDLLNTAVELFDAVLKMVIEQLPQLIPVAVDAVLLIVGTILDNLDEIITAAITIIVTLVKGIGDALPQLIPAIVDCILTIVYTLTNEENVGMIIEAAGAIISGLAEGILRALPVLIGNIPAVIMALVEAFVEGLPEFYQAGSDILGGIVSGIGDGVNTVILGIKSMWEKVKASVFGGAVNDAKKWGTDMMNGFIKGIKDMIGRIRDAAKSVASTVSSWLHFSRPDVGPLRDYETWMPDMINGMVKGIHENQYKLNNAMYDLTAGASGVNGVGRGGSVTNMGGVSINVQAAPGQSESAIADAVMEKMQRVYEGRTTVWA